MNRSARNDLPTPSDDPARRDLRDRHDAAALVARRYERAFADPVLGPIFIDVTRMDLDAHLPTMCDFWETVLFGAGRYRGNVFGVHLALHEREPLTPMRVQRRLDLWEATVHDLFLGPNANLAKVQAGRIGGAIRRRLERSVDGNLPGFPAL